jgi:hypothetical protein
MNKLPIADLRFTSRRQAAHLNCRRRREESLTSLELETRHLFSYN